MLFYKDFGEDVLKDKNHPYNDDFLTLMEDINRICEGEKIDAEALRLTRFFAVSVYCFAENTKGAICVNYDSKLMRLSVSVNYPQRIYVSFEGSILEDFAKLSEVSTNVIICPSEASDEDVMLIFEYDMR